MHNFTDAQEMSRLHPDTFEAPDSHELDQLKAGDCIKVCHNDERFWVYVTAVVGDRVEGQVDNVLVNEQPFSHGDVIQFEKRHIYFVDPVLPD